MISDSEYQKIPKDIAGSRTKKRFGYEIAYGILMIFDETIEKNDFVVIFDYACDLEKIVNDKIHFYQVKTKEKGNYTINGLTAIPQGKQKSILQTLVDLNSSSCVGNLYIVSNTILSELSDTFSRENEAPLSDLNQDQQNTINSRITWPATGNCISKVFFRKCTMPLPEINKFLLGETVTFLEKLYPHNPHNVSAFLENLSCLAIEKSSYDKETANLDETIKNKGITKQDMTQILDTYKNSVLESKMPCFETFNDYLARLSLNVQMCLNIRKGYFRVVEKGYFAKEEKQLLATIYNFYLDKYASLSEVDAIKKIVEDFPPSNLNLTSDDKYVFAICGLITNGRV